MLTSTTDTMVGLNKMKVSLGLVAKLILAAYALPVIFQVTITGSYKIRGYIPHNQLFQLRIAGFKVYEGIAGKQEY